jgi:hypothetical protein
MVGYQIEVNRIHCGDAGQRDWIPNREREFPPVRLSPPTPSYFPFLMEINQAALPNKKDRKAAMPPNAG